MSNGGPPYGNAGATSHRPKLVNASSSPNRSHKSLLDSSAVRPDELWRGGRADGESRTLHLPHLLLRTLWAPSAMDSCLSASHASDLGLLACHCVLPALGAQLCSSMDSALLCVYQAIA